VRDLIGFTSELIPAGGVTAGDYFSSQSASVASFASIEHVMINCNAAESNLNGNVSTCIAAITPDVNPGFLIEFRPTHLIEVACPGLAGKTNKLNFWLTDQNGGRTVDTNSEYWSLRVIISWNE